MINAMPSGMSMQPKPKTGLEKTLTEAQQTLIS